MAAKKISADLVVIGAGLAGTAAALAARQKGGKVCVIASNQGASAMSSGALDICGDPCMAPGHPERTCVDIARNITELLLRNPEHPYSLLVDSKDPGEAVMALFKQALDALFPGEDRKLLRGSIEKSSPFLTNIGTFKFSAFAPSHAAALDDPVMSRPLIMGFSGLEDFEPDYWIKAARENAARMGKDLDAADSIKVDLDMAGGMSSLEMAGRLENKECAQNFLEKVASQRDRFKEASVAVMPPILPFSRREGILNDLNQECGCEFRELISLPPSAPGMRLAKHMAKRLEKESVSRVFGRVKGFSSDKAGIRSLHVESSGKIEVEASDFILAAGAFLGGGIEKNPEFREPVFNLPVFSGETPVSDIFTEKLTRNSIRGPHTLFAVGLRADRELRPLGRDGKPVFDNLRAAGAILAGCNYLADGTGAGVALAAGFCAGNM